MNHNIHKQHTPLLSLENLSYSYHTLTGETKALDSLSFQIFPGEFIAIVGPSGCGKSTLLNILAGQITDYHGQLHFHSSLFSSNDKPTKKLNIGYMLQHDHLFPWRTILQNVCLGPEINHSLTNEKETEILQMLKKYGLHDFKDQKPAQLSGGMRQRAALIRTLALNPELLLLDEPFSALDYQTRLQVSGDIGRIIRENKKTAVLVTHNLSEAISLADKIIVLTKRPGTIKRVVEISLTISDPSPLGYRSAPEFNNYFNEIWEDLCHES
ncbi:MAG: ABC transporter ATP-binding protein [Lachnospiraceae bacterium]|nr:ABC transporter ATP-binding protein [Lachnospiraceae bacterium]